MDSATLSRPSLSLGDIERFCASRCPDDFAASATEDYDGVIVNLFAPGHRTCGFMVSRLLLSEAVSPHALLEVLTHEAIQKLSA